MTIEILNEIEKLTEENFLEALRSKRLKPETKAELGMKYSKHVRASILQESTFGLEVVSTAVQVAGLYTPANREEIARRILPSVTKIIDMDTKLVSGNELRKLVENLDTIKKEDNAKDTTIRTLTNRLEDRQDEVNLKEKPKLEEAARKEYDLKRNY